VKKEPEDMTLEDMLSMKINTVVCFANFTVIRVPGGWIYDGKENTFVAYCGCHVKTLVNAKLIEDNMAIGAATILRGIQRQAQEALAKVNN